MITASDKRKIKENDNDKLYIILISVHGLIRGHNLELGRDADTGGQTKYVVELARELGKSKKVARVDLITRRITDPQVDDVYSHSFESLSANTRIVRIECGEEKYIPKEQLWDSLENFSDNIHQYINQQDRLPNIIHSHYADAGYVGTLLSHQLGIPLVHTGHSLGRSKRRRLLASGVKGAEIEQRYNMSRRIEAEETILSIAERVITSTFQEIEEQYGLYDHYQPDQMRVIAPGTDLKQFYPPEENEYDSNIARILPKFLRKPEKPIILAISRPDQRKNIATLIEAYGESPELQQLANLVIVAGNRDDIRDMEQGAQEVLTDILLSIDQYNLYGKVAYPKYHRAEDVPVLFRLAALSKGVFINPALTEPFGLTLIEAAACGLPILATEDGGPRDIIKSCKNGYLIDPLDKHAMATLLLKILSEKITWQKLSANGIAGVRKHYSWDAHVKKYIQTILPIIEKTEPLPRMEFKRRPLLYHDRAIFSDLDQNLLGDPVSMREFTSFIQDNRKCICFGIATGRRLDSALNLIKRHQIPLPDVLITSLGTDIHYAPNLTRDTAWREHIDHLWKPETIKRILNELPGLRLQPKVEQSRFKISYYIDPAIAPDLTEINTLFHQHDITINTSFSFGQFLDIVPVRASKGLALRWFAEQWNIPLEHILAAGGSGADEDMMRGNTLAVVVANRHEEELSELIDIDRIYFAKNPCASGIMEAIDHYQFLHGCEVPPR